MKLQREVIGCICESDGKELCHSCRGGYFGSKLCIDARNDEDYQLIHEDSGTEQVTVFMVIDGGVIDQLLVLDTPQQAEEYTKSFLEDHGYSDLNEYVKDEINGHPKTVFKVFTREIQYGIK